METPDLAAEKWVAVLGTSSFLADGKISQTPANAARVAGLSGRLRREFRAFMTDEPAEAPIPPFNWSSVVDSLWTTQPTEAAQQRLEGFAPEVVAQVATTAQRAMDALRARAPRASRRTFTGDEATRPSPRALDRFRRIYGVLDDIDQLLAELHENSLTTAQVQAFAEAFPVLYEEIATIATEALADAKADFGESWELPWPRSKQLQILIGARDSPPERSRALQAAIPAQDAREDGKNVRTSPENTQTAVQRTNEL